MARVATPIKVSERGRSILSKTLNQRQLEGHFQKRMSIVYQASSGIQNQDIAKDLRCSVVTVRKWRVKWRSEQESLIKLEDSSAVLGVTDLDLLRRIKDVLSDAPRSGASCTISDTDKIRLQALACQSPEEFGLPFSVWTHVELSKQMGSMGVKICSSYCGTILKKRITTS